jgi:PAS domain S-box-containing protein
MDTTLQHRDEIAREWQSAIGRTSFVALERREVYGRLASLTDHAIELLLDEQRDLQEAREIGASVAQLGYVLPDALQVTLDVLGRHLSQLVPTDRFALLQPRLIALLSSIASGFSARARATILDEQESVRSALLTLREQAEEALRASEARFRAIFEGAAIGIAVSDLEGRIVQVNRALQAMLGYSAEEMCGRRFTDFGHTEDLGASWQPFQDLVRGETDRYEMEQRFVHKNGSVIWGKIAVSLIRDADGQPQFAIGMGEDITAQKQVEHERLQLFQEQAARSEAEAAQRRLAFLAEASIQLALSLDLETTLERVARSAVPVLADWCTLNLVDAFGSLYTETTAHVDPEHEELARAMRRAYPRRQEEGRSPAISVLHSGASRIIEEIDDAILERISTDEEHLAMWKQLAPKSVMIVPLAIHGRTLGTLSLIATAASNRRYTRADLAVAEDLGRRAAMAVENARLYAQAEEAVRIRDEFLSVAAHELKTPVTSLRGFAQLTLRTIEQTGNIDMHRLTRALGVVDQQSEKLTRLVAQLLDVSRFQSGKLALDCRDTNLSQVVLDLVQSLQAHSDRHVLRTSIPPDVHIHADPLRIEQVLTNLVDNAIKYSPEGGDVDVDMSVNADSVCISVRDHGIGISPEHRERIFERFYQADTRGHHTAGMGLGLYISHQIVDLHGGELRAEFPEGDGSRFIVSLPMRAASRS